MIYRSVAHCNTGHVGSIMNLIKAKKRTQFGDGIYLDLLFRSFNTGWI